MNDGGQRHESALRTEWNLPEPWPMTHWKQAALERSVLRRALVEFGLLFINRRSISLPLKCRKVAKIL